MKKFTALLLALLIIGLNLTSCGGNSGAGADTDADSDNGKTEGTTKETADRGEEPGADSNKDSMKDINEIKDWQGYLPKLGDSPDEIIVIQHFANNSDKLLAESLQGVTARDKAFLCTGGNNAEMWLKAIEEQLGDTVQIKYTQDVWTALDKYADRIPVKKYVLYDTESVNAACTIASAERILLASDENAPALEALGYTRLADSRGLSDADAIRQYKDKLNTFAFVQQHPGNYALRDFGIAYGLGFYFYDDSSRKHLKEAEEIHGYIDSGAPVFGWGPGDEYSHVKAKSNHGLITIPSDHAWNLSIFSALPREQLVQINEYGEGLTSENGKHYVAFMMTDGDNIQWMVNDFNNPKWFGSAERGSIPMAWMMPPALLDAAPQTAKWLFLQQTKNDVFVNALSGTGYFFPAEITKDAFEKQIDKLSFYMEANDFDTITIMDNSVPSQEALDKYAAIGRLKGGVLFTYPDYYKGAKGKIYWAGDKPFISVRNSLWNMNIESFAKSVAKDIKRLGYDITKPDAYTVIVVHCWSHTYSDAVEFAKQLSLLDEKIEFVRVDQLIRLAAENIKR